jgi:hypothetical protein
MLPTKRAGYPAVTAYALYVDPRTVQHQAADWPPVVPEKAWASRGDGRFPTPIITCLTSFTVVCAPEVNEPLSVAARHIAAAPATGSAVGACVEA